MYVFPSNGTVRWQNQALFLSVFSSLHLATQIPCPVWGSQELKSGVGEYWWEREVTENTVLLRQLPSSSREMRKKKVFCRNVSRFQHAIFPWWAFFWIVASRSKEQYLPQVSWPISSIETASSFTSSSFPRAKPITAAFHLQLLL